MQNSELDLKIEYVPLDRLQPHPQNPRVHPPKEITQLAKGMEEYGFTNPIIADTDGTILSGHARYKAAKRKKLTEVPVIFVPFNKEDGLAYMLAVNRIQQESEWDLPKLRKMFGELNESELDLSLTGFDDQSIFKILEEEKEGLIVYEANVNGTVVPLTFEEYDLMSRLLNRYLISSMVSTHFILWMFYQRGNYTDKDGIGV